MNRERKVQIIITCVTMVLLCTVIAFSGWTLANTITRGKYWFAAFQVGAIVLQTIAMLVNLRSIYLMGRADAVAEVIAERKKWAETVVPFHQGMTLEPGQTAVITIPINPDTDPEVQDHIEMAKPKFPTIH